MINQFPVSARLTNTYVECMTRTHLVYTLQGNFLSQQTFHLRKWVSRGIGGGDSNLPLLPFTVTPFMALPFQNSARFCWESFRGSAGGAGGAGFATMRGARPSGTYRMWWFSPSLSLFPSLFGLNIRVSKGISSIHERRKKLGLGNVLLPPRESCFYLFI